MTHPVSTKPYLLRAIHEWCTDQGYAPHISVAVDANTLVPRQFVTDGQIVLNIGGEAAHQLSMGNEFITFMARFSGVAQSISIPVDNVTAIYARETGLGMAFEVTISGEADTLAQTAETAAEKPKKPGGTRPQLTRVK